MRATVWTSLMTAAAAGVGSLGTDPESEWYQSIEKPSWQPPAVAFPLARAGLLKRAPRVARFGRERHLGALIGAASRFECRRVLKRPAEDIVGAHSGRAERCDQANDDSEDS